VVVGGDYSSVKLLNVEEVDLIADGPGLRVYFQTVACREKLYKISLNDFKISSNTDFILKRLAIYKEAYALLTDEKSKQ
jgi:hypothetical protein